MPFNYPATQIYDATGKRRVVWSVEEYEQALSDGFTETRAIEPSAALIEDAPIPETARKKKK